MSTAVCGEANPGNAEQTCIIRVAPGALHDPHLSQDGTAWPNESPEVQQAVFDLTKPKSKTRKRSAHQQLLTLAASGVKERRERFIEETGGPIVRNDDPASSHEAAERYQPKRSTAKGRVLWYLQQRVGEWIDAPVLTQPEVGGFAGTRRLRELREAGWPIETRPKPGAENTWQHRLTPEEEG